MDALILEKEPLALGAYSTRILRRDYQRALMRIRRLSDSAQADVRADSNGILSLDSRIKIASGSSSATTLGEFVANSSYTDVDSLGGPTGGTVTIWYDQSGSNKHMTQTVTNYQPRIVSSSGNVYQAENGPNVLFWPTTPDAKYMDLREMNGDFTVHLGFRLLGSTTSVKMYDGTADIFEVSRSLSNISLTNVTSSVTTVNGYDKGSASTIDFSGSGDSFVTVSGTFSSTGVARIGGSSGGVTDLYIYPRVKDGKRTKKVEAIQSRERSTPLAFSNRQDLDETAFLNTFQGAASAFSLRDLNGSSGTKLISVRRDVDNKEVVVTPDSSGYVSLESPVSWSDTKTTGVTAPSTTVSYATTLGQFLGDPTYSDPDSLGTPSNGYVVQMFDQVAQNEASGRRLLDYHTGAEVAYSFKRLSTAYTGAAFEVKAFVGGSVVDTTDIQFDSTGNSYANLASYISQKNQQYSGVGVRCSKWYDQSGNGRDLVQATESNMPLFSISEKNGELSLTAANGVLNMSVTGLSIPTPYSYAFSFDRGVAFDGDIISFDTDISVGIASGNYRITSESNVISGGAATAGTMKTIYGVHDGASSEIGVDGTYTSGTGASKSVSSVNLFPSTGFNGRLYEFILWGENKSSDANDREDIDLYSKDLYRTEDPNAKAIASTAQPKIYDATNGLITDGGRTAMDVASGNYFLFDKTNIVGQSTVSSFACFSTSDTRGGLYGIEGGYRGPYMNPSTTGAGTFLSSFGTPTNFLNGDSETISSAADGATAISDGTKNLHSLINADASSWTAATTDDITLFNFNSAASTSDTLTGRYQEFVFFTSDISAQRESIEADINNAFSSFSSANAKGIPKLLNDFPAAAAAYSVRQVNTNYTGPLMRIDNGFTEIDIYPLSNGDLDVESILEHVSVAPSGNAGVAVWYDQSGNGNDVVQAANSSQPLIASNHAIVYENGKPAVQFDGSDDGLHASYSTSSSEDFALTTFQVIETNTTSGNQTFTSLNNTANAFPVRTAISLGGAYGFYNRDDSNTFLTNSSAQSAIQAIMTVTDTGTIGNVYYNGSQIVTNSNTDLGTTTINALSLGTFRQLSPTNYLNGHLQEAVFYNTDKSTNRKEIESNINKYFDITPESPKPLLLDKTKEDAAAAYSLRKLSNKYTGPAVRVRRASDNVEVDVYFDENQEVSLRSKVADATETTTGSSQSSATFSLGVSTFGEFMGDSKYSGAATDGFVVCWYDQSRNSNDAIQNTAASQPKIYDSQNGLVGENRKPAVSFDNTDDQFPLSSNFAPASDFSVILVAENTTDNTDYVVSGGAGNLFIPQTTTAFRIRLQYTFYDFTISSIAQGNQMIAFANRASNTLTLSTNGSVSSNSFTTSGTFYLSNISYGGSNGYSGLFQELIMYESDQSINRFKIESDINNHYSIYQGSPEPKLLNSYSGAAAAYSLRLLDGVYTGPLVRVRRDSDNIEMDVYPDADGVLSERSVVKNKVETSTGVTVGTPNDSRAFRFGEFAYGANCYVVEWKDQSGNANHASQDVAASQPKIYDSSTGVVTENGKPAVEFDGTNDEIAIGSYPFTGTDIYINSVARCTSTTQEGNAYAFANGTNSFPLGFNRDGASRYASRTSISGTRYSKGDSYNQQQALFTHTFTGTTLGLFKDGTAATQTYTCRDSASNSIGSRGGAFFLIGTVQELVVYDTDNSSNRTGIESNINTFYNIY